MGWAVWMVALVALAGSSPAACGTPATSNDPAPPGARPTPPAPTIDAVDLEQAQRAYIELRFGMFIHFGILTYTGAWAQPNLPIEQFNPTALDPGQWADAAVAAHMTYGVLTTRHHDGFALWNSAVSDFDVGSIPWMNGQGDVVRAYVDAFRSRGLLPGLYYSVWDSTRPVGGQGFPAVRGAPVTADQLAYVEAQLTELLSNYGPIPILIFDGWAWQMGHRSVPYQEIRALVKRLQPGCLLLDHTHLFSPWEADIAAIEEPKGFFAPADNTFPATQEQKIANGNDWFWAPITATQDPLSVDAIVRQHLALLEPRWTNFLLNCPPNRDGLLDDNIVARLAEVGAAWSPDATRPPAAAAGPADGVSLSTGRGDRDQRHGGERDRRRRQQLVLHGLGIAGRSAAIDHRRSRTGDARRRHARLRPALRRQRRPQHATEPSPRTRSRSAPTAPRSRRWRPAAGPPTAR